MKQITITVSENQYSAHSVFISMLIIFNIIFIVPILFKWATGARLISILKFNDEYGWVVLSSVFCLYVVDSIAIITYAVMWLSDILDKAKYI